MDIANPIYDVVFKYLMEDNEIAKLVLSTIIKKEIIELDFLPQERTLELDRRSLTVYRLYFSAKIKVGKTYTQVIIEIQKAKFATDIMRFRRYLGEQYQNKNNFYDIKVKGKKNNKKTRKKALPLLSIYFLGYQLEKVQVPVIRVERKYYNAITNKEIKEKEEFIESLTHDSCVIQIAHLGKDHKTDLEQLLSLFDQDYKTSDPHVMRIKEEDYPEKHRKVIRKLQRAICEPQMRDNMDIEDDILEELEALEREIEEQGQVIEEKNQVIKQKDQALEEKHQALEEKDQALEEKDQALEEQNRIIEELKKRLK